MYKGINIPLVILSLLSLRVIALGASLGDAISIVSLASVYGLTLFLKTKEQAPLDKKIVDEIADMKSSINGLKMARSMTR